MLLMERSKMLWNECNILSLQGLNPFSVQVDNILYIYIKIYACVYTLVSVHTRDFPLSKADAQVNFSTLARILQNKILPQQQEVF